MGPRLRGGLSPCSCSLPFPRPSPSVPTPRDWSASRCRRRSSDAAAQRQVPSAQQPPSLHRGLFPDLRQWGPLAPSVPGPSGPCTASPAQKPRSPPAQADLRK